MRTTIGASHNPAVLGCARTRNNGRYNGNGREWMTPPEVFDPLMAEFGFTLDPCATDQNRKCRAWFTEHENGLVQPWGLERVFMNPPYGREIYAWTRKARESARDGALVVGLLPASTDLAWWHDDVVGHAEVRYIKGRVRFLTDGPYRASGFFPSIIAVWRPPVMPLTHGYLTILVRRSTRNKPHPFTAFIAGTPIEGCGETVQRAVEDLFTSDEAGEVCKRLEQETV